MSISHQTQVTSPIEPHAGSDRRISGALDHLRALLPSEETVEAWATQRRIFALHRRRSLLGVTSHRLLILSRRLLRGYDPVEIRWQDLNEVEIGVGLLGATLTFRIRRKSDFAQSSERGRAIVCTGLRPTQAQTAYRLCVIHADAWREKRRVRAIEELRARSGGVQLGLPNDTYTGGSTADPLRRLQAARQMLETGIISDTEFETIKARIVNRL